VDGVEERGVEGRAGQGRGGRELVFNECRVSGGED